MAYIMDMASGTVHPVEEPAYQVKRSSRTGIRETARSAEYPELQLAMLETQMQAETQVLPAASIDALLKTLED